MKFLQVLLIVSVCLVGCQSKDKSNTQIKDEITIELPKRPNILWLVTEDMGAYIPPFGDMTVPTPNLSKLASEGVIYPNLTSKNDKRITATSRLLLYQ